MKIHSENMFHLKKILSILYMKIKSKNHSRMKKVSLENNVFVTFTHETSVNEFSVMDKKKRIIFSHSWNQMFCVFFRRMWNKVKKKTISGCFLFLSIRETEHFCFPKRQIQSGLGFSFMKKYVPEKTDHSLSCLKTF